VNSRQVADSELHYTSRCLLYSDTEQIHVLQQLSFFLHSKVKDYVVSIYSIGRRTKLLPYPLDK